MRVRHIFYVAILLGVAPGVPADVNHAPLVQARVVADVDTLSYVRRLHDQLNDWALRLSVRLETGVAPRRNDPSIDGRARLQVKKLRVYAARIRDEKTAGSILALADAHERRLDALDAMIQYGFHRDHYSQSSADVAYRAARLAGIHSKPRSP